MSTARAKSAPTMTVREVLALTRNFRISGLPVVENGKVVGIVTNRDTRFETNLDQPVRGIMTPREPMFAEDRANVSLWMQNTSFGAYGVNGMQSGDFLVKTSAHFLTTFGIAGRDTIAY